ncbi:MAG TPA: cytochrome C biogenesis protein [Firmicutes bacterium]|nr:cytochrome C biogenesis protein [Bacillota bacterium]
MTGELVRRSYSWRMKAAPYVFISPFFILFLIFSAFPLVFSLHLSLQEWNGLGPMKWAGFKNYAYLMRDPVFWKAVWNTVVLMFQSAVPQHVLALTFAFILNSRFVRGAEFFKAALFLPYLTSSIAIALLFKAVFSMRMGLLNFALEHIEAIPLMGAILKLIGLSPPVNWLGKACYVKTAISALLIWQWTGWNAILYLAGLQAINPDYYDAARVDGATWPQVFFRITLPLLRPMILFAATLSIIGSMQLFTEPLIMTDMNGGPGMSGYTIAMNLYQVAFDWMYFGSGAAISWVLFIMIFIFSWVNTTILRGDAEEERI